MPNSRKRSLSAKRKEANEGKNPNVSGIRNLRSKIREIVNGNQNVNKQSKPLTRFRAPPKRFNDDFCYSQEAKVRKVGTPKTKVEEKRAKGDEKKNSKVTARFVEEGEEFQFEVDGQDT